MRLKKAPGTCLQILWYNCSDSQLGCNPQAQNEVGSVGATLKLKQRRQIREGSLESGELERRWNWWEWVGSLVNSTFESELSSEERQGETPGRSAEEGFLTSRVHRLTRCSSKVLKVVQEAQCLLGTPHLYHWEMKIFFPSGVLPFPSSFQHTTANIAQV